MAEMLDQIDALNSDMNAIVALRDRRTLLEEVEPPGPLQGVPMASMFARRQSVIYESRNSNNLSMNI